MEILFVIAFYTALFSFIIVASKKSRQRAAFNREGLGFISKLVSKEQLNKIIEYEHAKKIKEWQEAGLISTEQEQTFSEDTSEHKKKFVLRFSIFNTLLCLGVGCIVVGIIALVAANYDKIPPIVRLCTVLILLTVSSIASAQAISKRKTWLAEACLLASVGLVGAAIGLVSQTFHLLGRTEDAIFLWALLSLPYVFLSSKRYLSLAWYPIFFITFSASSFGEEFWRMVERTFSLPSFLVSVCFFSFALMSLFRKSSLPFARSGKDWLNVIILFSIIIIDAFLTEEGHRSYYHDYTADFGKSGGIADLLLLLVSAAACVPQMMLSEKFYKVLWIAGVVYGVLVCFVPVPLFGVLLTLAAISFVAYTAAKKNLIKLFNFMAFLFFLRIVVAYFNLFMTLAQTGVGAILIGLLILLGLKIWATKKQNLINYIQKGN